MYKVILLSYGSPERIEDVPEYLSGIFNGKKVPENILNENIEKYRMVNGKSPSNEIIKNIMDKLSRLLNKYGDFEVTDAYKHWKPGIEETVESLNNEYESVIALPLFAFKSNNVSKSYEIPFKKAILPKNVDYKFINGLDDEMFTYAWIKNISKYIYDYDSFLFTAHSLPLIDDETDYINSLHKYADKISKILGIKSYYTAFYSQGPYGKWIEPSIYSLIDKFRADGIKNIAVVPLGFLYEHLEILYDLDVKYKEFLAENGIEYVRAKTPSCSDELIILLKNVILKNLEK
ncbi:MULTISPECIES: ferrochelatase [Acidiplasma]|jgi:ferrochelatase|uniref:Uncharacterized protein n=3 Tax=Acidiplasma TaxID=507753 RepID=A0A0Q0RX46_9ARCH|nr:MULTISPECIES: ferrochelatase [Acidiplasma]KPV47493.1 hypothetical protein SE19_00820 [Acidiplasma aeolicum]KQB34485.1 hypothetical protein AOG55_00795 [Acidiplasma cupricumulans]WMT55716.1 MAG: ferrochelatase [Acidiplasma sp.]